MSAAYSTFRPTLETLEDRIVPSTLPDIAMTGATTTDSRSISVSYNITGASITGQDLNFNIYRSANYNSTSGATLFATAAIPASDAADLNMGSHQGVRLQLLGTNGEPLYLLLPNTAQPFLVVQANPNGSIVESDAANDTNNIASFETHTLGVIVHGFEFSLTGATPAWEQQMAASLQQIDGYQAVIAFNWVFQSELPIPGMTVKAANRLAPQVQAEVDQLASQHPGDVVDINFIGHSRGDVVISQVVQQLANNPDPALHDGYIQMTMLDPHPANNFALLFSWLPYLPSSDYFAASIYLFQAFAQDPLVFVPSNVTQAEEFDQQSTAGQIFTAYSEYLLNLWGVPPSSIGNSSGHAIDAQNLTNVNAPGVGLVGHEEMPTWYQTYVINTNRTWTYFQQQPV